MTTLRTAALVLALSTAAATAHAGVNASAIRPGNWEAFSAAQVFVPLNGAGATTLTFNLGSAGKKVLTYSAECVAYAPAGETRASLDLDIYVNGVAVVPTLSLTDPFCSSNGSGLGDGWVRASITVPIKGIAGTNTVQIKARGNQYATGLWLGDSALVIHD